MNNIINWHKKKYPLMEPQDVYKLLYQGEFGSGHAITSKFQALERLLNEMEFTNLNIYQDLYEEVSDNIIRVNLAPYKLYKLDPYYLFDAFIDTSNTIKGNDSLFLEKLKQANIDSYNVGAVHHSKTYVDNYHPHYRIISKKYLTDEMRKMQIINFLSQIKQKSIIALEGKCGSGKTTITNYLKSILPITVINVDDFFLPKERKTNERLSEIGGNVDYERIHNLLLKLKENKLKTYQKFNCSNGEYEEVEFENKKIILLEGVYSYHQNFRNLIDYLIFLDIDNFTQDRRLRSRSNYQRFIKEWIPLENRYFEREFIKYLSDIIV